MSRWASAESPRRAFGLSSSATHARTDGERVLDWRGPFGELWSKLALGDLIGPYADPGSVGIEAMAHFEGVQRDLLALWEGSGASRRSVLRCAAVTLESSARVWQAFGPAAGQRHLHLLHRLEDTLILAERQIRAAELPLLVNRPTISLTARAACAAIDDLLVARADPVHALAGLEDAAVDLASLAVRIALNLDDIAGTPLAYTTRPAALRRQLEALACEVSNTTHDQRVVRDNSGEGDHLGAWLSTTLRVARSSEAIELASLSGGDPCLCADALCSLRARWLELAVGLWAIVQTLDELLVMRTFADEERLKGAVSSRAASALVACELYRRPGDFDHVYAWGRQREALHELVSDVCLALEMCEPDTVVRSQQCSLRRLARAVVSIWAIDERLRSPLA